MSKHVLTICKIMLSVVLVSLIACAETPTPIDGGGEKPVVNPPVTAAKVAKVSEELLFNSARTAARIKKRAFAKGGYEKIDWNDIPNTVKEITVGDGAFEGNKLTGVTLPDSVVEVQKNGFKGKQIASLTLGKGTKTLGESSFEGNNITALVLQDATETVEKNAFKGNKIATLTLGKGTKTLGESSFEGNQIKELVLTDSTQKLGDGAFEGNPLTKVTFPARQSAIILGTGALKTTASKIEVYLKDTSALASTTTPETLAKAFGKLTKDKLVFKVDASVNKLTNTAVTSTVNALKKQVEKIAKLWLVTLKIDGVERKEYADAKNNYAKPKTNPTKTGHKFLHWYKEGEDTKADAFKSSQPLAITDNKTTLIAAWQSETYDLTFNLNGGAAAKAKSNEVGVEKQTVQYLKKAQKPTAALITKKGYTFRGWVTEKIFNTPFNFDTDTITSDTTLYAKWVPDKIKVTFNTNKGTRISPIEVDYDTKLVQKEIKATTRTNYTFVGWFVKKTDGSWESTSFDFANTNITAPITLYAKWTPKKRNVSFQTNGGTAVTAVQVDHDTMVTKPTNPIKVGHSLDGWFKDAKFKTKFVFNKDKVTADITLYAKWKQEPQKTVTFESNGGTTVAPVQVDHDTTVTKPSPNPTLANHTFGGWFVKKTDGSLESTSFVFSNTNITADITLYAKWTINQYTVTFDPVVVGGSTQRPNQLITEARLQPQVHPQQE